MAVRSGTAALVAEGADGLIGTAVAAVHGDHAWILRVWPSTQDGGTKGWAGR